VANQLINRSRRDYYRTRLLDCEEKSPGRRWRTINELLHANVTDKTRTDQENSHLCRDFIKFFVSKIDSLKLNIAAKLAALPHCPAFFEPPSLNLLTSSLPPVTPAEVLRLLSSLPAKSSPVDHIPPSLIKSCSAVFSELISVLANLSFREGHFPTVFKHASVTPLLKKPSLDKSLPSNYRPISNLHFISKILERLFLARIQPHVLSNPNFNQYQSGYRRRHSTETSLLSTLNSIYRSSASGKSTLLISLDLNSAFDTIDHRILLNRLQVSFGFTDSVLSWLSSYLVGRSQSVRIGRHVSQSVPCTSGLPQGSVLGPILFTIYTSPIASIAHSHHVSLQQYADDTQLYIGLSPDNPSPAISTLTTCLSSLQAWFCLNGMALNPDKSEAILLGTTQRAHSYTHLTSVDVAGCSVPLSDHVKVLGVTLDSRLSLDKHIANVCKSAHYHMRALRYIRSAITDDMSNSIACALVGSRLDYANSALFGVTQRNINRLQRVQNTLARIVTHTAASSRIPSASLLNQLHWLPVDYRIKFKLATITYNVIHSSEPAYLRSLLESHAPARSLRSSSTNLLHVPLVRSVFGSRGFSVAAPTTWNSLPPSLRTCTSLSSFRRHLKAHYFSQAFAP
jgi:hypothetical protein